MFQKLSKKLRKKQGFTLIELIVVLAILGIILAIAVPNYLGVQAQAQADADARTADLAEKAFKTWYTAENITGACALEFSAAGAITWTTDPTGVGVDAAAIALDVTAKKNSFANNFAPANLVLNKNTKVTIAADASGAITTTLVP